MVMAVMMMFDGEAAAVCDDGSCDVAWLDANVECGVDFGFGDNDASARDQRHKERR